ncbi:butyryl-CoA dehydrogenase [Ichthyobacterium seriolicida]|uniref:Acyl-coenzyme A dehydrogenase n=1 Tax=Ichthyobacterium seriolicida TaxID=242600 RepID=A0A1J1DYA9_9FLAO|nr:butyryl-CoA dehydrogenase [Ichthyobacterium seriolicida]
MPKISVTEQEALEAGTTWFDKELFSGNPDWKKLYDYKEVDLTKEELAFLDGPTEQVCNMIDEWDVFLKGDMSSDAWKFIKEKGFLGMLISKDYGGLGFSPKAQSAVIGKLFSSHSSTLAITVMVPNSLGPGELLLHYGTERQKNKYLPKLASGELIPCFALTGVYSGSDAANMRDIGVVCEREIDGKKQLGIELNFEKRYITLAPISDLIGLAFKMTDPDGLLGDKQDLGITLALVESSTKGIEIGSRHYPGNQAFYNGPVRGTNVFIGIDQIIGEKEYIGKGWKMLMDCLSTGRSISLPAVSAFGIKSLFKSTVAYSSIRYQFNMPIGQMEGVQEGLTDMALMNYQFEAARSVTADIVSRGEKPSVISAILKYQGTEKLRETLNHAMDIHGGKGISNGPNNYLFSAYNSSPICITVEGANILTRTLIVFGQGSIRCHPYLLKEIQSIGMEDSKKGKVIFDKAISKHVGFLICNVLSVMWHNLTRGVFIGAKGAPSKVKKYSKKLTLASLNFSVVADLCCILLGGKLKAKQRIS